MRVKQKYAHQESVDYSQNRVDDVSCPFEELSKLIHSREYMNVQLNSYSHIEETFNHKFNAVRLDLTDWILDKEFHSDKSNVVVLWEVCGKEITEVEDKYSQQYHGLQNKVGTRLNKHYLVTDSILIKRRVKRLSRNE